MADYFIESKNGEYPSWDGKRKFIKLSGKEAYEYLQTEEGRKKRFMKVDDDKGQISYFEIPADKVKKHRKDERKAQYSSDCKKKASYTIVPLYIAQDELDEDYPTEETIADPSVNVEDEALHNIDLENLRKAIKALNHYELFIADHIFSPTSPFSERRLSRYIDIPQKTLNCQKRALVKRLKKAFF